MRIFGNLKILASMITIYICKCILILLITTEILYDILLQKKERNEGVQLSQQFHSIQFVISK